MWIPAVLICVLLALAIVSMGLGRLSIPPMTVLRILLALITGSGTADSGNEAWAETQWVIVEYVRLPRVVIAATCGVGLALGGAVLQGLFRNPLVGPEVAGVSHGAAFGGVVAIVLSMPTPAIVTCAFAGGLIALIATFALARLAGGGSVLSMVLAGVIVGAFFGAGVGLGQFVADPETQLPSIVYWLLGSFARSETRQIPVVVIPIAIAGTALLLMRWRINLLSLGEADAAVLGIRVGLLRWVLAALVAVMIAAQVSVSGGIGWIGLVVPHFARMLVGADHRALLPVSALLGGIFLLAMDDIARTATDQEIPIGLLTAIIGTPVFAFVFLKLRNKGWGRE
ncbi:MAG: iron ABC transporter permease [Gammaproteobacteria bacterium]